MSSLKLRSAAVKGPWQPRTYRITVECIDPGHERVVLQSTERIFAHETLAMFRTWRTELAEYAASLSQIWNWELRYVAAQVVDHD